jgi:hypothetical protein
LHEVRDKHVTEAPHIAINIVHQIPENRWGDAVSFRGMLLRDYFMRRCDRLSAPQ